MILGRERLLFLALIGAEGAWLWGAFALLGHAVTEGQLQVVWLWLLYPAGLVLRPTLAIRRMSPRARYSTGAVVVVIASLLITWSQFYSSYGLLNPAWLGDLGASVASMDRGFLQALVVLMGGPLAGGWGWHLAEQRVTFSSALARFQFGTIMLLIVLGLSSLTENPVSGTVPVTVIFFTFALGGMVLGRGEWGQATRQPLWTALSLGSVLTVLAVGLLLIMLLTPDFLRPVMAPVKWVGSLIMVGMEALMEWWPMPSEIGDMLMESGRIEPTPEDEVRGDVVPGWLWGGSRVGWFVLMIGLLLLALFRISGQIWEWLRKQFTTPGAQMESLDMGFGLSLRAWIAALLSLLLRGRWPHKTQDALAGEASLVRHLYRSLLQWGLRRGQPRSPSQTPLEYLEALDQLAPERRPDFEAITRAYLDARYGPTAPDPQTLPDLQSRWRRVKKTRRWRRRAPATA